MNQPSRAAAGLAIATFLALGLLSAVQALSKDRINAAKQQWMFDNLAAVLPAGPFDNNPVDSVTQHVVAELGADESLEVYRAYRHGKPIATVLELVAPDGYSGAIRLLLGLHYNGRIIALRVIDHKETPGLGDKIESRRSDWTTQFNGKALSEPAHWQLKRSDANGQYDALSGATITSRAVLHSIRRALQWYANHREELFDV